MKTYKTKPNDNLGGIARKFGMPSWKYLYQINKDKIGDNPDLLKEGTILQIPEWDTTTGDELLRAKGVDPKDWTDGLRYKYPWISFSFTITDSEKKKIPDFEQEKELVIWNYKTKKIFIRTKIKLTDSFERLVPDSPDIMVGIKDFPLELNGKRHFHPDDEF